MQITELNEDNCEPFIKDEDGYPVTVFFRTEDVTLRDERDKGRWLIGALFFPSAYEEFVGKGNPVYSDSTAGVVKWHPIMSNAISDFLEGQGPGSTDMQIPLKTVIGDTVYIYTGDGACGDSIITCPVSEYNLREALRLIEKFHLEHLVGGEEDWGGEE